MKFVNPTLPLPSFATTIPCHNNRKNNKPLGWWSEWCSRSRRQRTAPVSGRWPASRWWAPGTVRRPPESRSSGTWCPGPSGRPSGTARPGQPWGRLRRTRTLVAPGKVLGTRWTPTAGPVTVCRCRQRPRAAHCPGAAPVCGWCGTRAPSRPRTAPGSWRPPARCTSSWPRVAASGATPTSGPACTSGRRCLPRNVRTATGTACSRSRARPAHAANKRVPNEKNYRINITINEQRTYIARDRLCNYVKYRVVPVCITSWKSVFIY